MTTSIIWLPAALIAGLFQAWRTAIQQSLRKQLTVSGAGLVRYLYGAPIALLLTVAYLSSEFAHALTYRVTTSFFVSATFGGLAQILGTNLLIAAFGYRNFVVGTAFSKTEAMQAAVFAWFVLGETLSMPVILGIALGVAGVLTLSLADRKLTLREIVYSLKEPAALCGVGAGALFALTSVLIKQATIDLHASDAIAAALITLTVVMCLQTLMHGAYVAWREPATCRRVLVTWRTASQVGVLSAIGSACWFIGFATAPVALVRIVGQVEVIFTLLFAHVYLRERTRRFEIVGLLLVVAGVIAALYGGIR